MSDVFSMTELAAKFKVPTQRISMLFYNRKVDPALLVLKGGRRFVPQKLLSQVEDALKGRGH